MNKSIHSEEYKLLLAWLQKQRIDQDISARALSAKLNAPHSWVSKIEAGERRLDVIEYLTICQTLGIDACQGFQYILGKKKPISGINFLKNL